MASPDSAMFGFGSGDTLRRGDPASRPRSSGAHRTSASKPLPNQVKPFRALRAWGSPRRTLPSGAAPRRIAAFFRIASQVQ